MKNYLLNGIVSVIISFFIVLGFYLYFPVSIFDDFRLGSTITTILSTDTLKDSRAVINTNYTNLNTDKLQSGDSASLLTVASSTIGTLRIGTFTGTSTSASTLAGNLDITSTATSTWTGGLSIA